MDFITRNLLKFIISGLIPVELGFSALAKQERLLQEVLEADTGIFLPYENDI